MLTREPAVPPFSKIFDEILVNAADNKQRDKKMSAINVTVELAPAPAPAPANGKKGAAAAPLPLPRLRISVYNDGKGIPVTMHATEKMYIPELIFGHLLTGSNFDDNQSRLVGGRHGYGAKLTNIFSSCFEVETYDAKRKLLYRQQWTDNMFKAAPPAIETLSLPRDYTKITFEPDLARFGVTPGDLGLLEDTVALLKVRTQPNNRPLTLKHPHIQRRSLFSRTPTPPFAIGDPSFCDRDCTPTPPLHPWQRRVVDVAACVAPVGVTYNGAPVGVSSFAEYVQLFSSPAVPAGASEGGAERAGDAVFHTKVNDRWEVAVRRAPGATFEQVGGGPI